MKNALFATVAALGLFAAGATFTSVNPAARPAEQVAASENTRYDANAHFAASENYRYDPNARFAASENDHADRNAHFASSENTRYDANAHFA